MTKQVTASMAAVAAIKAAGRPLTANEIATAVVDSGVVKGLKGKTPKATISAMLLSKARDGKIFKRSGDHSPVRYTTQRKIEADPALVKKFAALVG